jgi:hypothetical protein
MTSPCSSSRLPKTLYDVETENKIKCDVRPMEAMK